MKNSRKAFTLVEMLIVIVIIGILAAALIPRLQAVQARARDTKRKADLQQIGGGLAVYKSDFTSYAALTGGNLTGALVNGGGYLTALPTDPVSSTAVPTELGFNGITGSAGNYGWRVIGTNAANDSGSIILGAVTEVDGSSSNAVVTGTIIGSDILATVIANKICTTTVSKAGGAVWTNCIAGGNATRLRYYYAQ